MSFFITFIVLAFFSAVVQSQQKVKVSLYYETFCPLCQDYYLELLDVVNKLGPYIDVQTFPFGNARVLTKNGKETIKCQHGALECYLNQVSACAIDILKYTTAYVPFNACIIQQKDLELCNEDANFKIAIKECANGNRGFELSKYHGEESARINLRQTPYALVNGNEVESYNGKGKLFKQICEQFRVPPQACYQ